MINTIAIYLGLAIALFFAIDLFILIYSKLSSQQRADLGTLAGKAISLVEQDYQGATGGEKMSFAIDFLDSWVNKKYHTKFTPDQIRAAVQFAFDHSSLKHDPVVNPQAGDKK